MQRPAAPPVDEFGPLRALVDAALAEDLHAGDVTSRITVPADRAASGRVVAKQRLVFAGGPVVVRVFSRVDPTVEVELLVGEGDSLEPGTDVVRVQGPARSILAAERTALNLLQRSCGVATLTRAYVDAAEGRTKIVDTRKTMPCLRALDRYAVRCGGAFNHRNDLGSGVLVKENHVRCAGGVGRAVRVARASAPHTLRVECEVTTLDELREALDAGADAALLDNMSDQQIREAVEIADGRAVLEASGNVTLERIPRLAQTGVDLVSVGALTHSAPAADLSLLLDL